MHPSNNSLPFLITSTDNKIGDTGTTSLSESLKSNTALTALYLKSEDKRRHTKDIPQQFTLISLLINRQQDWRKRNNIIE